MAIERQYDSSERDSQAEHFDHCKLIYKHSYSGHRRMSFPTTKAAISFPLAASDPSAIS